MSVKIQVRRGTAATWTAANPTLSAGEFGFETDTNLFKIGDGSSAWTGLAYAGGGVSYYATVTGGGTTTLTNTSKTTQNFTGTLTQTVQLPAVSTLQLGWSYQILNNSTQSITVTSSGGNTVLVLQSGFSGVFTSVSTTGTTAASWDYQYSGFDNITGTGNVVFSTSPSITGATETNLTLAGTLTANSSTGTSGQFLSSTGTGTAWASVTTDPTPTVFMLMGA
jgi:Major tropism determinant N-terminal domain